MLIGESGVSESAAGAKGRVPMVGEPAKIDRIGPNAVTRLADAIFDDAALAHYLEERPASMLDEREVITLHRVARQRLGEQVFAKVAWLAGQLTGDYILANRIPMPAQTVLKRMPRWLASRVLAKAITAHAWTFVGSGEFSARARPGGMLLTIRNSPLARMSQADIPLCGYYSATFERIFSRLVGPNAKVEEVSCLATGAKACCFDVAFH